MKNESKPEMKLYELPRESPFKFVGDKTETVYWFRRIDGMYAQVFSSEKDMEEFINPAFVSTDSRIVQDGTS